MLVGSCPGNAYRKSHTLPILRPSRTHIPTTRNIIFHFPQPQCDRRKGTWSVSIWLTQKWHLREDSPRSLHHMITNFFSRVVFYFPATYLWSMENYRLPLDISVKLKKDSPQSQCRKACSENRTSLSLEAISRPTPWRLFIHFTLELRELCTKIYTICFTRFCCLFQVLTLNKEKFHKNTRYYRTSAIEVSTSTFKGNYLKSQNVSSCPNCKTTSQPWLL